MSTKAKTPNTAGPDVTHVLIAGDEGWTPVNEGSFSVKRADWFGTVMPVFHFIGQYGGGVSGPVSSILAIKTWR